MKPRIKQPAPKGEEAYRRGYWHGYDEALHDIHRAGLKKTYSGAWDKVSTFFWGPLTDWYHGDTSLMVPPPAYEAEREGGPPPRRLPLKKVRP